MEILWEKSINIIKDKVSSHNFDTWIRPIKIVSMDGNNIHLEIPNKFFKDWLIENYLKLIEYTVSSLVGSEVKVNFIVSVKEKKLKEESTSGKPIINTVLKHKTINSNTNKSLNKHYTFDRFVVGSCNQFAHAASLAVAEKPAKNYNPLFIYGGVGLGKTHLVNAIGHLTTSIYENLNVLYVSAEEFMNELISSIRYDKMPKFREKYRNIGCLLIDDIQFLAGKERTQEEFFHTFNSLHDSGKQIVVTSDRFPKDIPNLENRLRSRFEWGLIADIQPPDIETKVAIIEKKAYENNLKIPQNVAHYIATNSESNIREIEGFIIRLGAFSSLSGREINMELAKEILKKLIKQAEKKEITVDDILKAVSGKMSLKISDVKSQSKNKNLVLARQISMYLSRKLTSYSFPDIGEKIGGRDHSTVIYAFNKISSLINKDVHIKKIVDDIEEFLKDKY